MFKTAYFLSGFCIGLSILMLITLPIMAVDYFANGCVVDYDHVYSRKLKSGDVVYFHGAKCKQILIHTTKGKALEGYSP
jgi:hypothetical protein